MNNQVTITICGTRPSAQAVEEIKQAMVHAIRDERCRRATGRSLDAVLTQHRRQDVGHELVLPERARKDHR